MTFLSHGNPEKLENMAETGKHNSRFAETGKVLLEAIRNGSRSMVSKYHVMSWVSYV